MVACLGGLLGTGADAQSPLDTGHWAQKALVTWRRRCVKGWPRLGLTTPYRLGSQTIGLDARNTQRTCVVTINDDATCAAE